MNEHSTSHHTNTSHLYHSYHPPYSSTSNSPLISTSNTRITRTAKRRYERRNDKKRESKSSIKHLLRARVARTNIVYFNRWGIGRSNGSSDSPTHILEHSHYVPSVDSPKELSPRHKSYKSNKFSKPIH